MIKRMLMQRNCELLEFEADPITGEVRIIDVADNNLAASAGFLQHNKEWLLAKLIERRALSPIRKDIDHVLRAFGAKSPVELALRGYGLSLCDQFWYRSPNGTERWEDINFFDNEWDPRFGSAVLSSDYTSLATCSPNVPEVTTSGHAIKAWERNSDGIQLIKAAERDDGADLMGVKLASEMCFLLFDESYYTQASIVERQGRLCTASPLILDADEELADGNRIGAITNMQDSPSLGEGGITTEACDARIKAYDTLGIEEASAYVTRMACFSCFSLLMDFNPSNFGAIRKINSNTWRAAPIFDYDGAFGFPLKGVTITEMCENPLFTQILCANRFAFLKSSWDWSWYDLHKLDGFEEFIVKTLTPIQTLPSNFAELIAHLFIMQRDYVNEIALGNRHNTPVLM